MYSIKEHIILTFLFMSIIGILWYYNPISETMTCDKNYQCKIEHLHLGNFKITDNIKISPYWLFDEAISGGAGYQERHIIYSTTNIRNKLLFKKGLCSYKEGDVNAYYKCKNDINNTLNNIKTYIKNPENSITLHGTGGINYLQKYFLSILILYILGMLINNPITSIKELFIKWVSNEVQRIEDERENKEYYGINTRYNK